MSSIFDALNPFRCLNVYRQEFDLIKEGQRLIHQAQGELDLAYKGADLVELAAAKQNAQLSAHFAAKALAEL